MNFYDSAGVPLLILNLKQSNGLYYCPIATPTTATGYGFQARLVKTEEPLSTTAHNRFPTIALPTIPEDFVFEPYLDPLAEQPFEASDGATIYKNDRISKPPLTPEEKCCCKEDSLSPFTRRPIHPARHLESELWAARLGHCGEWQLDHLPGRADGTPKQFLYHPFRFADFKEQARIRRQAAGCVAQQVDHIGKAFYVDFCFIWASTTDFSRPDPKRDRVVKSFNGFNSYLLIVDEASRNA